MLPVPTSNTIVVNPLNWGEWTGDYRPFTTAHSVDRSLYHYLVEKGKCTNGYRYTIYGKREALLIIRLRPPCCERLPRCSFKGRAPLPTECRETLREAAKALAYQSYLTFIKDLTT